MWSLGVVLFAMLVGEYPFWDTQHPTLVHHIMHSEPDFRGRTIDARARALIISMLDKRPERRATYAAVAAGLRTLDTHLRSTRDRIGEVSRHAWTTNSPAVPLFGMPTVASQMRANTAAKRPVIVTPKRTPPNGGAPIRRLSFDQF